MPRRLVVYSSSALLLVPILPTVLAEATLRSFLFLEPFHFDWVLQSPAHPKGSIYKTTSSKVRLQTRYLQNPTPNSDKYLNRGRAPCKLAQVHGFRSPARTTIRSKPSLYLAAVFRVTNTQPKLLLPVVVPSSTFQNVHCTTSVL